MDIKQCRDCGKLFQSFGSSVCMECTEEKDRAFIKVRDYIYAHPETNIVEITENTDVKEKWIMEFLREERLTLGKASGFLNCEQCGKPITSGRLCNGCKDRMQKALESVLPQKTPEKSYKSPLNYDFNRDRMYVVKKIN